MSYATYRQVLEIVSSWPPRDRIALAHDVLETLQERDETSTPKKPSFERALGIARGDGPPPSDEQVKEWIDEYRMGKYGR